MAIADPWLFHLEFKADRMKISCVQLPEDYKALNMLGYNKKQLDQGETKEQVKASSVQVWSEDCRLLGGYELILLCIAPFSEAMAENEALWVRQALLFEFGKHFYSYTLYPFLFGYMRLPVKLISAGFQFMGRDDFKFIRPTLLLFSSFINAWKHTGHKQLIRTFLKNKKPCWISHIQSHNGQNPGNNLATTSCFFDRTPFWDINCDPLVTGQNLLVAIGEEVPEWYLNPWICNHRTLRVRDSWEHTC